MLQVRIDDETKKVASKVFERIGLDLSTAIRIFLLRSISEGGMPFDMKLSQTDLDAIIAIEKMRSISEANGNSEMTLDEINEVIKEVRSEMKLKNEKNLRGN